jgi:hypothetical protein
MSAKPTPGPWRAALKSEKTWNMGIYDSDGNEVASVNVRSAFVAPRRDADAHLIAAAHELFAELEAMTELFLNRYPTKGLDGVAQIRVDAARAALAKARGEA